MTANHLLSASLFSELFQHHLVSADGRIIASDEQLKDYSTFLIRQTKDRVASLHLERKNMVCDAEELLGMDSRIEEEEKLLNDLLNELSLKYDEDGLLAVKESRRSKEPFLGPKEPKKSIYERKVEADLERAKMLKRDLKKLDDWLEQISHFDLTPDHQVVDWREAEKKYRQRTANRICDLENARMKLVKNFYKDYDDRLEEMLNQKLSKRRYLSRKSVSQAKGAAATKSQNRNSSENNVVEKQGGVQRDADDEGVANATNARDEMGARSLLRGGKNETNESENDTPDEHYAVETNSETKVTGHAQDESVSVEMEEKGNKNQSLKDNMED